MSAPPPPSPPFDVSVFRTVLTARAVGQRIDCHESVPSTMTLADERLKAEGAAAAHGSIILAESQTGGIGRRGRSWLSPPRGNLYFSLLWAPAVHLGSSAGGAPPPLTALIPQLAQLNLAASVAVVRAAEKVGVGAIARIKWPNDVWAGAPTPRKLSGTILNFDGASGAVLGVGINVAETPDALTQNATATSLAGLREAIEPADARPPPIVREAVLAHFCNELERLMGLTSEAVLGEYRELDLLVGRVVRVHHRTREEDDPKDFDAEALGVSAEGMLRVRPLDHMKHGGAVKELSGEEVSITPQGLVEKPKEEL